MFRDFLECLSQILVGAIELTERLVRRAQRSQRECLETDLLQRRVDGHCLGQRNERSVEIAGVAIGHAEIPQHDPAKLRIFPRRNIGQDLLESTRCIRGVSLVDTDQRQVVPGVQLLAPFAEAREQLCGMAIVLLGFAEILRLGTAAVEVRETGGVLDVREPEIVAKRFVDLKLTRRAARASSNTLCPSIPELCATSMSE